MDNEAIFPFTEKQLEYFRKEITEAGTIDKLLEKKEAIGIEHGLPYTIKNEDLEAYKKKHLIGIYAPLQEFYSTDIPFSFWQLMYEALLDYESAAPVSE